jgi:hypothetical protein
MDMRWRSNGFSETINLLAEASKEGYTSRKKAVKDVGQMIKKELTKLRQSGTGLQPLGIVSKLLGHKKPWGKKKFVVYTPRKNGRNPFAIVTTKGANKSEEEGREVTVSEKFRRFLHYKGIHLKKGKAKIPPRPIFRMVWERVKSRIPSYFGERFHYHLGRAIRKWSYSK